MWWAGSERLTVYLSSQTVGVTTSRITADAPATWLRGNSATAAFELAIESASEGQTRERRRVLDIHLSGALARPFVFEALSGLKSRKEACAVAAKVAPDTTGLIGPCTVWLDAWTPGQPCVAVAIDTALRDHLENVARRGKIKIAVMQPWWKKAIDAVSTMPEQAPQLLAAVEDDSLTVITSNSSKYISLVTYSPTPEPSQARAVIKRAAMSSNLQPCDIVSATLGTLSSGQGNEIDINTVSNFEPILERWK